VTCRKNLVLVSSSAGESHETKHGLDGQIDGEVFVPRPGGFRGVVRELVFVSSDVPRRA
jgi:hypothetical protein